MSQNFNEQILRNCLLCTLLFRRHVCFSNLTDTPSREVLLAARKTVFNHLKYHQLM